MAEKRKPSIRQAFKPRARLLQLLGDQLIGSSRLALFELVKNAYDADADKVTIEFSGLDSARPTITVQDNGSGMALSTIRDVWLVPGHDHREAQRHAQQRTPKYRRLPLGEKGVGRFAVHKLGNYIQVVTRAAGQKECVIEADWSKLLTNAYLQDARISVFERPPEQFKGAQTGTRIQISDLHDPPWNRGEIRQLYRQVTSIASPFGDKADSFEVELSVPEHREWISTLPGVNHLLDIAPFTFRFEFDGEQFRYWYNFNGIPGVKVEPRTVERIESHLQIPPDDSTEDLDPTAPPKTPSRRKVTADASTLEGIGNVEGKFYIFDRDKKILSKYGETEFLQRYLDQNGGVRIYRDRMRVYNYGERSDDWLGLDLRRVNEPSVNLSRNIVVGAVDLDLNQSSGLKEKTNREGFVETDTYRRLRRVVKGAMAVLETERHKDKERIRVALGSPSPTPRGIEGPLGQLRRLAKRHKVLEAFEPTIRKIDQQYDTLRQSFLQAGVSQVGVAVVIHEIERGVSVLVRTMSEPEVSIDHVRMQAGQLQGVLETSTQLLRKSERKPGSLKEMVRTARDLSLLRFRLHGVKLTCPALEDNGPDAKPTFSSSLVLGALTNIIDNAVHWLKVRYPPDEKHVGARRLYINIEPEFPGGPAIIVADNGPGFIDEPEHIVQPFFSRRPGGSGLGLYFANLVMDLNEGHLVFPTREQADVPEEFDGAVVALVFGKRR